MRDARTYVRTYVRISVSTYVRHAREPKSHARGLAKAQTIHGPLVLSVPAHPRPPIAAAEIHHARDAWATRFTDNEAETKHCVEETQPKSGHVRTHVRAHLRTYVEIIGGTLLLRNIGEHATSAVEIIL